MRGRKRVVHDNRAVMQFLWKFGEMGQPLSTAVPDWVDSCVAGASRYGGRNPSSPNAMLSALSQLPEISTEVMEKYVNRKWIAMGNKPFSDTHAYYFFMRVRMASKAISFHYQRIYGEELTYSE